jgi:ABC-type branched-subunit amino acid transport system substrate-binding protein
MRRSFALLCLVALAGCGSTVQVRGQALSSGDGLGGPAATAPGTSPVDGPTTSIPDALGTPEVRGPTTTVSDPGGTATATGTAPLRRVATGAPVAVGIRVPNASAGAVVGNLTGTTLDTGDPKAMATAVVRWINTHGGLAGHRVEPVFYENCAPLSCDLTVQDQQICSAFTQDHHVVAMVDATETSVALATCLARAGVVSLGGGVASWDGQDYRAAKGLHSPYLLPTDTAYRHLVARLDAMGWFVAGEKVGLLVVDTPTFRRTAATTKQALKATGRSFADEAYWASGSNGMSAIVLQFQTHDIKRVVVVETGSAALLQFLPAASAQGYYPKVTVTSADVMGTLALIASPQSLAGAAGIGWQPAVDAAPNAPTPTATARLCAQIYREAKLATSGPLAGAFASAYCDGLLFARAAFARASDLSLASVHAAVEALGSSYVPAATFSDRFGPGRFTGTATTRDVRYDTGCSCFRYSSNEVPVA